MKKKLNLSFCESLIHSDFFLINRLESSSPFVSSLNIALLTKQLKQFIRLLLYLNHPFFDKNCGKMRFLKKKLYVFMKTAQGASIVQQYFANSPLKGVVSICEHENYSSLKTSPKKKNICVSLGTPSNNTFFQASVNKNLSLFTIFDGDNLAFRKISTYKVLNKLENIKKKIFLVGLIEMIVEKKLKHK